MNEPPDKKLAPRKKLPALGRGLAALLGDDHLMAGQPTTDPRPGDKIISLPLERLEPNPFQPRRVYDQTALQTLADSIAQHGVIQPLVVRPVDGGYQLIAGERRLRASQLAGLGEVPVVVRQATNEQALLLALLENLQREDLNPLEEARAFQRLGEEFALSQDDIAAGVGKDRSTVANILRLLKLPQLIQDDLETGRLSAGHGRAILALGSEPLMRKARDMVLKKGLSVRATERLVKDLMRQPKPVKASSQSAAYVASLAEEVQRKVGTKVEIKRRGKKGQIVLHFFTDDDLERLLAFLR
jgi:ParB family transcriptional regulator, chromosome partitioning protein